MRGQVLVRASENCDKLEVPAPAKGVDALSLHDDFHLWMVAQGSRIIPVYRTNWKSKILCKLFNVASFILVNKNFFLKKL